MVSGAAAPVARARVLLLLSVAGPYCKRLIGESIIKAQRRLRRGTEGAERRVKVPLLCGHALVARLGDERPPGVIELQACRLTWHTQHYGLSSHPYAAHTLIVIKQ